MLRPRHQPSLSASLPDPSEGHASVAGGRWLVGLMEFGTRKRLRWALGMILLALALIGLWDYKLGVFLSLAPVYLAPIVLSVIWIGWRTGCLVSVLSVLIRVGGDLAAGGYVIRTDMVVWNRLADLGTYLAIVAVVHALVSLQRQLETRVHERTQELEKVLAERAVMQRQLFDISRRERSSIGHELHDGLGQHLTATSIAARMLADSLSKENSPSAVSAGNIVRLLQDAIAQTRRIAKGLLLAAVEPDALAPELEELSGRLQREHRIGCTFSLLGEPSRMDVSQSSHLYYIAQEAARNALRHARATHIAILLSIEESAVFLSITDNGVGLPLGYQPGEGMGLRIMVHRAELLGGALEVSPAEGGGTCVSCRIPLALRKAAGTTSL